MGFGHLSYVSGLESRIRGIYTVENKLSKLDRKRAMLLEYCREPRTRTEMMAHIEVTDVRYFRAKYLVPMQQEGSLRKVELDKSTSRHQKYIVVTGYGNAK